MSFSDFSISIIAQNLASAEFAKVASDAGVMAAQVSGQRISLEVEDFASPEISRVAEDAATVKAQVEASPMVISFAPVEVPVLPPIDTTPVQESFNEVGVAAAEMGADVGAAGESLTDMATHAEVCEVSLRSIAGGIRSFSMMGTEITMLATNFGLVDSETSKYLRTITVMITLVSTAARMYSFLSMMTTGQTAAVAIEGTTETATAGAISLSAVAHNVYATACWVATTAQNALNISHATFLALTGVGIAVVIAAAAAMSIFASQMNAATSSVKDFNATASETPTHARGIQRAGEESMYRRGVE